MQNLVAFFSPISSVFDNVQSLWKKASDGCQNYGDKRKKGITNTSTI